MVSTLGTIAGIVGAALVLWWRIDNRIAREAEKRERLAADLAQHKIHVAEAYATKTNVGDALNRFVEEVRGLRADMKQGLKELGDRIARVEEHWLNSRKG